MQVIIKTTIKWFGLLIGLCFANTVLADDAAAKKNRQKQAQAVAAASVAAATTLAQTDNPSGLPVLQVSIKGLEDEAQQANAKAFLDIFKEQGKAVENPSYARYLANVGAEQIQQSLQPFGYYLAEVKTDINEGRQNWTVNYHVKRGKPVRVAKLDIIIKGEGKSNPEFIELLAEYPLKKGDILDQQAYSDFKDKLLNIATTDGYFDADFSQRQIVLADDFLSADILLTYDTGKRYAFGTINLTQDFLDQDVIDRYKTFPEGKVYSSKDLAELQRDLYNAGYVKVIDVTAEPDKDNKKVPVTLNITPKKNKKHTFALGYGTDSGARGRYDFDWRWVNRRGHQFKSRIFASQKQFRTGLEYKIPGQRPAYDQYRFFSNFERQWNDNDKETTMYNVGGAYRDVNNHLTREFGIKWQQEDFSVGNDSGSVGLLAPYIHFTYRKVDDPIHIKDGLYLDTYLTAAHDSVLSDVSLLQAVGKAKAIKTFAEVNRLTLSGALGRTWTKDFRQLPVAYRFFTGGDKTIRGYRFESIGDTDSSGKVVGGNKMYYISGEYEYFFRDNMAAAVFIDAGDAYSADSAKLKVGAGVGFHYYSPIGPIKVDVAHGFDEPGDTARLHFSIGSEF